MMRRRERGTRASSFSRCRLLITRSCSSPIWRSSGVTGSSSTVTAIMDSHSVGGLSETGYEWLATEHNQIPIPLDAYSAIRLPVPSEWVTS